ncbi:MAG: tetratricopeptide repeat protein [Bradymonadaceae bacterium]|nr:tetratricopeptide repeat protein [Lujinxingiaceae bacterium]
MERYYVKRPTGKVFGPFDQNAIKMMLKGNKLGADAHVSTDKLTWQPLADVPAFAAAIGGSTHIGLGGREGGTDPLSTIQGGWDAGLDELPGARNIELPGLRGEADLPASRAGSTELPGLRGTDLPGLRGDNLPGPREAGLPTPSHRGLPQTTPHGLPISAGSQLPASRSTLPVSRNSFDDDLFESDDDDLFGAPKLEEESDLFGAPKLDEDSDDLFAAPSSKPAPAPAPSFAPRPVAPVPLNDDLFGAPVGIHEESDDLFSAPIGQGDDDDDLFESNRATKSNDDFLGGDAGFSFLDESPPAAASDAWDDDLIGNNSYQAAATSGKASTPDDDWGDDLLGGSSAPSAPARPVAAPRPSSPSAPANDPFRPASTGQRSVPAPSPTSASVVVSKDQAVSQDKKRGLMVMVGVPIVAVLVLGAAGMAAYNAFSGSEGLLDTPTVQQVRTVSLALDAIKPDNFSDFQQVMDSAAGGKLDPPEAGKLLAVEALFLMRYEEPSIAKRAEERANALPKDSDDAFIALGLGALEARSANPEAARAYLEPLITRTEELAYFAQLLIGIGEVLSLEGVTKLRAQAEVVEAVEDGDEQEVVAEAAPVPASEASQALLVARAQTALRAAGGLDPKAAAPLYWLARLELKRAKPDEAIALFERAINADPTHVASRLSAGRRYYMRGDLNNATEHLQKIITELAGSAAASERGEAHHLMGMVHQARRQSTEAIAMFTEALKIDASRADTLRALAEEYERAKMYKEALNFFTTDRTLGQQDPEVMLGIVRSHMGLEQWSEAISYLERGQQEFPEDARFPFYLGQLNELRGTFFDARKAFERSVEIDPAQLTAHASLAQLAWRIDKDVARGETHVKKIAAQVALLDAPVAAQVAEYYYLVGRRDLSKQWNQEALRLDPNFWNARLALSRVLLEEGENQKALTLLERARTEGIEDIRLSAYLADAYRQSKRFDQAIEEINSVIEQFPGNEDYIFIRGRIYFDRGNYDTAREDFNKAYELNPRLHEAYFYVGRSAFEQADYNNAKRIFRHVLDYQPNNGEFHFFMGRTFEEEDNLAQALESYRRATVVDPEFGNKNPSIYIRRGRILSRLGYTREGKRDITLALERAPHLNEARLAMGESDFRDRNYKSAIKHYSDALTQAPEDSEGQYRLGMSYIYEGQRPEGARHLQLAIRYGYSNPDIYRTLGYLYKELGQSRQALDAFKSFIRETANHEVPDGVRREMLRQISELGG